MNKRIVFYDAYLNESGIKGGSCSSLFNLINGIREKSKHEIILLSNTTNNPYINRYLNLGVEIVSNKYLRSLIIYGRSNGLAKKLIKYSFNALAANLWFIGFLRHNQPDIIVYNDQRASSTFILTNLLIKHKIQIISIIRGTKEIGSSFNRISYKLSSTLITVSQSVKNSLPDIAQKKAIVIHNGIESRCVHNNNKTNELIHLITVANIARYKGIDLAIHAISRFSVKLQKKIVYHIVGAIKDTSYYEELRELYLSLKCEFIIKYEGIQEDVYTFLSRSDIFILPSREEGFGLVLLEAMDCSLPLIGSSVGGIPEIVKDGYNGFIFDKNNHVELEAKLKKLIEDKALREKFAENSKIRLKQFSIDQTVQKYLQLL